MVVSGPSYKQKLFPQIILDKMLYTLAKLCKIDFSMECFTKCFIVFFIEFLIDFTKNPKIWPLGGQLSTCHKIQPF